MGRKHLSFFVAASLILTSGITATAEEAKNTNNIYEDASASKWVLSQEAERIKVNIDVAEVTEESTVVEELKRPDIPGIPLDDKLLDYIWNKAQEDDWSYEFLLAMAKVESNFDVNTESSTRDGGLFQINRSTGKWIAEELELNRYNLYDPYTSTDFAVYYLGTLRDAWKNKGLSEEELFDVIVISYNRGVAGANKYINKYGTSNNTYLKKIKTQKYLYEKGE